MLADIKKCRDSDAGCSTADLALATPKMLAATQKSEKAKKDKKARPAADRKKEKKERIGKVGRTAGAKSMVMKMPSGCTSETNCEWICKNMVNGGGARDI